MPAATSQARNVTAEAVNGFTSFFDAPFTASSNQLLECIYTDASVNPSTRLLLFIARYSTGYLKPEVVLKESFILEATGMSRSSLYKAKKELLDSAKITISHTKTGNCVYRLVAELQCLKGSSAPLSATEKARQRWSKGSAVGDPPRPQVETPSVYKEIQENYIHHQTPPFKQETPQNLNDDASLKSSKETHITQTSPGQKASEKPTLTESQLNLVKRLQHFAVTWRLAENLVRTNPHDVIECALKGVVARKDIINPAGWLVREIQAGGYLPPRSMVADQMRRAVETSRISEKSAIEAERERQEAEIEADRVELDRLPPERFAELLTAARAKMAWLPKASTANSDNPFIRGAMLDLLREVRLQQ